MTEETKDTKDTTSTQTTTPVGIILMIIILCAAVAGGIYWFTTYGPGTETANDDVAGLFDTGGAGADTAAFAELPDVVAEVNGVAITKETLENIATQISTMYAQQGMNLSDLAIASEVRTQALESVINAEVLSQAAAAAGTSVEAATIEEELASVQAQFPDEATFAAELEAAGITLDELRADVTEQLTVNTYIMNTEEFTAVPAITDEEAREFYDQSVAGATGEVPAFEEVRPQIDAQLTQQKQQEAVSGLVEKLRAEATVDVKI